jgi:predicted DCC family thiol-disulfide oxidoreductase YuxK
VTRAGRLLAVAATVACGLLAVLLLSYHAVVVPLLAAALDGRLGGAIQGALEGHRAADPAHRDLEYYARNARIILGRGVIASAVLALLGVALARRRWLADAARRFFAAEGPPIDLAILRIVIFCLFAFEVERSNTLFYSALPAELLMPPAGLGWLPRMLPIDPQVGWAALLLFRVACVATVLGCFTRVSAVLAVLSGAWSLAIPQLYGKLNHDHHVIWFAALLAVSPCADVLAIDAVRAARRRADRGAVDPPGPARAYALPIRVIWVLLGIVYFFPGFWKIWTTGFTWISADNLRNQMFLKWREFDGWTPMIRIDAYPPLLLLSAIGTVAFELSFIVLVLSPRLRAFAALGGLVFHNFCALFLKIPFISLQVSYAALVEWGRVLPRLGRALFGGPLYLVYDGGCRTCRRGVASLATMNVLGGVVAVDGRDDDALRRYGLGWLDRASVADDVLAVSGQRVVRGWAAYRATAARLPPLWLAWPFLFLWPASAAAEAAYERVGHRHAPPSAPAPARSTTRFLPWEAALGGLLIAGTLATGTCLLDLSWPVALYPTFAALAGPTTLRLVINVEDGDGVERPVDLRTLNKRTDEAFQPMRLAALVDKILKTPDPELKALRLNALWGSLAPMDPSLRHVRTVRFFRDTVTTVPERRAENPLSRQFLLEITPQDGAGAR